MSGTDPNLIFIDLQMENGVLRIYAGRKRIFSSTSWTFFGWTVGSSIILFGIALMFLRGQVRPILPFSRSGAPAWDWTGSPRLSARRRARGSACWPCVSGDALSHHAAIE
jgi:hypothetical protein